MSYIQCARCPWQVRHILDLLQHFDDAHGGRPPVRAYDMVPVAPEVRYVVRQPKSRKCAGCYEYRYIRKDGSCWCWDCMEWVQAVAA